jgi:hypothetical protein
MIAVQTSLGKDPYPISKGTSARRPGGISQVVEDLPHKYKALSSECGYGMRSTALGWQALGPKFKPWCHKKKKQKYL